MFLRLHILVLITMTATLVGCRFEDRTPGGARRDDASLDRVAGQFYRALADRDTLTLAHVTFATATALVDDGRRQAALVPMRSVLDVHDRRTGGAAPRVVRTELRTEGGAATARIVIAVSAPTEMEAVDFLTLARDGGEWRVAHALFGPWRSRAP